ncbi:MAG: tRNA (guanine-N7)-methyltransferase, partial [Desulfuromonadales bacterium]
GDLYFSTDFDDYAEDVAAQIHGLAGYRNMLSTAWTKVLPGYPFSKYMQRFLERGEDIYFIHSRRDMAVPRHALPAPVMQRGFRVRWPIAEND